MRYHQMDLGNKSIMTESYNALIDYFSSLAPSHADYQRTLSNEARSYAFSSKLSVKEQRHRGGNLDARERTVNMGIAKILKAYRHSSPRVLELGCGAGVSTRHIASIVGTQNVIGVELSPAFLNVAKRHVPGVKFVSRDITNLTQLYEILGNQKFDVVTLADVMEHIPKHRTPGIWNVINQFSKLRGWLYVHSPAPVKQLYTRALQYVEEVVEPTELTLLAHCYGFRLKAFHSDDNFFSAWFSRFI